MLSTVLAWLGSLLGGPFVKAALDAYKAKLEAGNSADKIAAELAAQQAEIDLQREQVEQASLATVEGRYLPFMRWGFAFPFVAFNAKAIIWDRMLHMGVTDPLSPELLSLESVIVAAYFGHSAVALIGRAIARK